MKRADIKAGHVYGYNESMTHIYRYQPVLVISTDLYQRPRYGSDRSIHPADQHHTSIRSGRNYQGDAVGLLVVFLHKDGLDDLDRAIEFATPEAALAAINHADTRDVTDAGRVLGRYALLTSQRYLHGDYAELEATLEHNRQMRDKHANKVEQARLAAVAQHNELADRLDALGITGYHVPAYAHPGDDLSIRLADLELLVGMAERYASEHAD
jgi:hypothetical protein